MYLHVSSRLSHSLVSTVITAAVWLAAVSQATAQDTANYIGPNNGLWSVPDNWDIGQVPINGEGDTFNAIIPGNTTVNFDVFGQNAITGFSLGLHGRLNVPVGRSLETLGFTGINGLIDVSGEDASFQTPPPPFTSFTSNGGGRVWVSDGGYASILAPTHSNTQTSGDIFLATGTNSVLDLSSLSSMSFPLSNNSEWRITASNNGFIDLSNMGSLQGLTGGNGIVRFNINSGGMIDLSNLQSIAGRVRFDVQVPVLELPALESMVDNNWRIFGVSAFNQIQMPVAHTMNQVIFDIEDGGVISAPSLQSLTRSRIDLNPSQILDVPPLANIDHSWIYVRGGKVFDQIAATTYTQTFQAGDIFLATDTGSVLDLSSLSSMSFPLSNNSEWRITASNNGFVDLSNVGSLQGLTGGNGIVRFNINSGGMIDLSNLQSIAGRVRFVVQVPVLELPALESMVDNNWRIFGVSASSQIQMPAIDTMNQVIFDIEDGGVISAPSLQSLTRSRIDLNPSQILDVPPLANIDHSWIYVRGGKVFDQIAATTYTQTFQAGDIFLATDTGSVLDLSSLSSMSFPLSNNSDWRITASNNGFIDLTGLELFQGLTGGSGFARFNITNGGMVHFGDVTFTNRSAINLQNTSSRARFLESVSINSPGTINMTVSPTMSVARHFSFNHTNENQIRLEAGILHMDGSAQSAADSQNLEVGGADLGLPSGSLPLNFQIGQLIVGDHGQSTFVRLVDKIDNGNRGPQGQPEALYLQGLQAADGLRIRGGSTLIIGPAIEVYAVVNDEWVHINALFPEGENVIEFDDGNIIKIKAGDLNGDGKVDGADLGILLANWGDCDECDDCIADLNGDCKVDGADLGILLANWG